MNNFTNCDRYVDWTDVVAKYPKTSEPFYLALGIAEELAELCRCKKTEEVKEAGDALWYCGRYAKNVLGVKFSDVVEDANNYNTAVFGEFSDPVGVICGVEKKRIRDGHLWTDMVRSNKQLAAYNALVQIVAQILLILDAGGSSIRECLEANVEKLSARLEAGTIQGDGDNR